MSSAVTTSGGKSSDGSGKLSMSRIGKNNNGGDKELDYFFDVVNYLQNDSKSMSLVKKYAFLNDINVNDAISNMIKMTMDWDKIQSSPFYKASLKMDNISMGGLLSYQLLTGNEKCISLNIGPLKIFLCATFDIFLPIVPLPISFEIKVSISGITIFDKKFNTTLNAPTTINENIGIADVTLKITFGVNGKGYYVLFDVFGEIGVGVFKTKFGPFIKRVILGRVESIYPSLSSGDESKSSSDDSNSLFLSKILGVEGELDSSKAVLLYILENECLPDDVADVVLYGKNKHKLEYVSFVQISKLLSVLLQSGIQLIDDKNLGDEPKNRLIYKKNKKMLDQYLTIVKCGGKINNDTLKLSFGGDKESQSAAQSFANLHAHCVRNFVMKQQKHKGEKKEKEKEKEKSDLRVAKTSTAATSDTTINQTIEALLNGAVGKFNEIIPDAVRSAGLDPDQNTFSTGTQSHGVTWANYSFDEDLTNLEGLSQMEVNNNGFSNTNVNVSGDTFTGSTSVSLFIGGTGIISLTIKGWLKVNYLGAPGSTSLSGQVVCNNVTASATAKISGTYSSNGSSATIDTIVLSNLNINAGSVKAEVYLSGFPSLQQVIANAGCNLVKTNVIGAIEGPTTNVINDAIRGSGILPIST